MADNIEDSIIGIITDELKDLLTGSLDGGSSEED